MMASDDASLHWILSDLHTLIMPKSPPGLDLGDLVSGASESISVEYWVAFHR